MDSVVSGVLVSEDRRVCAGCVVVVLDPLPNSASVRSDSWQTGDVVMSRAEARVYKSCAWLDVTERKTLRSMRKGPKGRV